MVKREKILSCLAKLQKYFGRSLDPEIQSLYVERLEKLEDIAFEKAMVRVIDEFGPTSQNPFPLIKDILALCGQDGHTQAVNAVYIVKEAARRIGQYQSVDFGDSALHAVIKRYGGWPEVVLWGESEWRFRERNFITAYEAAVLSGIGPDYCPGMMEIDNTNDGFAFPAPIKINSGPIDLVAGRKQLSS